MDSLYKLISALPEADWNYYFDFQNNIAIPKPIVGKITSVDFINRYFKKGGKENTIVDFNLDDFCAERADHTVSIFFFGLLLFHNTGIKSNLFYQGVVSEKYEFFLFIWFMTCLSHDLAFYQEEELERLQNYGDIQQMKERFAIEHDLLILQPDLVPPDMFSLCSRYFDHRHKNGRTDHGIFAGLLMYDRLVKNRLINKEKVGEELLWEDWLDGQYAYAAATIAVHNMWFPQKKDFEAYTASNLGPLIGHSKISFQQAPLLFLLGLVDTLDPVKAYWQLSPALVLKNVSLSFLCKGTFNLHVSKNLNFSVMARKVSDMEKWLLVRTVIKGNQIKIKFMTS